MENSNRKDVLKQVRKAIRKYQFTPRELSSPNEVDVIMIMLSIDEFPYKIRFTKLAIICFIGSRGVASRSELHKLMNKDFTTISHGLTDLRDYGFINETIEPTPDQRSRIRKYTLTDAGKQIFEGFISFYQQKIIETCSAFQEINEADSDSACNIATSKPIPPSL